jgi:hypothetical protein
LNQTSGCLTTAIGGNKSELQGNSQEQQTAKDLITAIRSVDISLGYGYCSNLMFYKQMFQTIPNSDC